MTSPNFFLRLSIEVRSKEFLEVKSSYCAIFAVLTARQRGCWILMFSLVCVILSTGHEEGIWCVCLVLCSFQGVGMPDHTSKALATTTHTVGQRAVRILLEYCLVLFMFFFISGQGIVTWTIHCILQGMFDNGFLHLSIQVIISQQNFFAIA